MSGETYVKRYPGGFVDLPAQTTAIDSQFLNTVEQALVRLLGEDPADGEVPAWSASLGRLVYQFLTNAQVAPGASISRTKLDFGAGLVDADIAPGAAISSSKISGLTGGTIPSGVMVPYGGSFPPSGWLLCDGSAVSRATYAGIFSAIGTAYGVGDGTTTFNLPDLRGRVPVGVGTHADVGALGLSDGQAIGIRRPAHSHAHTLTLPNHGHSITDPTHGHSVTGPWGSSIAGSGAWSASGGAAQATGTAAAAGTGITVTNPTSNPAINGTIGAAGMTDTVPFATANWVIKT